MNIFVSRFPIAYIWMNPSKLIKFILSLPWLIRDYINLKKQLKKNKDFQIKRLFLIADDKTDNSWSAQWHYFHQDLYVAQKIFENNPSKHVDFWSRVDGFVTHVASFRLIEVFDIRPLNNKVIKNIQFTQCDLMWDCSHLYQSTDSLSCLHTIEHFWLWRYWDTIDVDWHLKWLDSLYKILNTWGVFYFSTPIWLQRIEFNAHRVFSVQYLLDVFKDKYLIKSFSYVDDNGDFHIDVSLDENKIRNNFWCIYGCGIFELIKK